MQQFFQSLARIEAGLAVLAIELRENLQCRKAGVGGVTDEHPPGKKNPPAGGLKEHFQCHDSLPLRQAWGFTARIQYMSDCTK